MIYILNSRSVVCTCYLVYMEVKMKNITDFQVDETKCIGCGLCKRACPSMLIDINVAGKAQIQEVERMDWYGCWGCQHCLAVCPQGAISVLGRKPEDSLPLVGPEAAGMIDSLIAGRRSCRHYKDENVDPKLLEGMLKVLECAPTGGNKQKVEYTIIDDKEQMAKFRKLLREGVDKLKAAGTYPYSWDEESFQIMEDRGPQAMNGDIFFCSAPHLFIPHMPKQFGSCATDVGISLSYFELMCAAKGLGAVFLGFPLGLLRMMPELQALLQIPEEHYVGSAIGFGYPEFTYARGVQKDGKAKIHRLKF